MNFKKIKKSYSPWTFAIVDNFLNPNEILKIKKEILNYKSFDDKVMVNRTRINKGSKNFNRIIQDSKNIKKFYNKINSINFYKKIRSLFDDKKLHWFPETQFSAYSKSFYGEQRFSLKEKIIKKLSFFDMIKTSMNLDIDFSISEKGYYRSPHRDRDTRVISFLLYLNTIDKNHGGSLEIHESKKIKSQQDNYARFPNKNDLKKVKKIQAKAGRLIVFFSSPDSYHAAEEIKKDKIKRVFIYGSYSLNKKVTWIQSKNDNQQISAR